MTAMFKKEKEAVNSEIKNDKKIEKKVDTTNIEKKKETTSEKKSKTSTAKKPRKKRERKKEELYLQIFGSEYDLRKILEEIREETKSATDLKIYLKPEEKMIYYVADGVKGEKKL